MIEAQSEPTDEHVTLQKRTQSTSADITKRIRERLEAFSAKHADCLGDSDPPPAPRTSLTTNETTSRIRDLETSKMTELKKVVLLDEYRVNGAAKPPSR